MRPIRVIDLDPARPQPALDDDLWSAAADTGFFQVVNHGITQTEIDAAFAVTEAFFDLPAEVKAEVAMPPGTNSGWEMRTQRRPSTGTLDQKESYQVTVGRMEALGLWPDGALPELQPVLRSFERRNHALAMRILGSFARRLGFADDFFARRHDPGSPHHQSTLRLLHYLPLTEADVGDGMWRAGAHTDYDCLTLLHQRPGQGGLQVCPGREARSARPSEGGELAWTDIEPHPGTVTCNIGDMLTRWSDDELPSTLHRVRMPRPGESTGPRFSVAYFAQADRDAVITGPRRTYPPITAGDFLEQRIAANFSPEDGGGQVSSG